jgi:hypothetical protein
MSSTRRFGKSAARTLAPKVTQMAPGATAAFIEQALDRAIKGVGRRLPGAVVGAEKRLAEYGDVDKAIHGVVESHVRYAGAQGFVTNLGGLVTMAVTVPANISGLAILECHMVAEIAHLRGYDLDDPKVRSAILISLLGEERVLALIKSKKLPGTPLEIASATVHDPGLTKAIANEVASELIARAAGKRIAGVVGRRIPVRGGVVGASADGYATWKVGRYSDREFLPRKRR